MAFNEIDARFKAAGINPARFAAALGIHRITQISWRTGRREFPAYADVILTLLERRILTIDDLENARR